MGTGRIDRIQHGEGGGGGGGEVEGGGGGTHKVYGKNVRRALKLAINIFLI